MIQLRTAKVLAAALMGILLAAYIYHDEVRWMERGREAFLEYQGHRFDRIMHPHLAGLMIDGIVAMIVFIGLYELVSALIGRFLPTPVSVKVQE